MKKGIDVSAIQGSIDWRNVFHEVDFAWIKTSEGSTIVDSRAQENARSCDVLNIPWGVYHFAYPQKKHNDALDEIAAFKAVMKELPVPTLGFALDLENNPDAMEPREYLGWVTTFIGGAKDLFSDSQIYIYGSPNFLNNHLPAGHGVGKYKLWLADYIDPSMSPDIPGGWDDWSIWQYGTDIVSGIDSAVDVDKMR